MPPLAAAVIALIGLVAIFSAVWAWQLKSENAGMVDPVWAYSLGLVAVLYAVLGTGDPVARADRSRRFDLGRAARHASVETQRRQTGRRAVSPLPRRMGRQGGQQDVLVFPAASRDFDVAVDRVSRAVVPRHARRRPDGSCWRWCCGSSRWRAKRWPTGSCKRFKADPANRDTVCRVGLWRYSRHPNYFFECVHWVAYIALSIGMPWAWFTLLPPVLMAFLLLKLSGIPLLEESMAKRRPGLRRLHAHHQRADSVAAAALNMNQARMRLQKSRKKRQRSQTHEPIHDRPHYAAPRPPNLAMAG